jgi:hypothetical protein
MKKILKINLLSFALCMSAHAHKICEDVAKTKVVKQDCDALVDFYYATNGPSWTNNKNWLSDKPVVEWNGVFAEYGRVSAIVLASNNLEGTIPDSFKNLTELKIVDIGVNFLTGTLPIGNFPNLEYLGARWNNFSGPIPQNLVNSKKLYHLSLYGNKFSGKIPSGIGNLTKLKKLYLSNNNLSGVIPESLGNLSALEQLYLSINKLSGKIPSSFGNLTNLEFLEVGENQFEGTIPGNIFKKLNKLVQISADGNFFGGSFTKDMISPSLRALKLHGNCMKDLSAETLNALLAQNVYFIYYPQKSSKDGCPVLESEGDMDMSTTKQVRTVSVEEVMKHQASPEEMEKIMKDMKESFEVNQDQR